MRISIQVQKMTLKMKQNKSLYLDCTATAVTEQVAINKSLNGENSIKHSKFLCEGFKLLN